MIAETGADFETGVSENEGGVSNLGVWDVSGMLARIQISGGVASIWLGAANS